MLIIVHLLHIQICLFHTLTYTPKLTVNGSYEQNFTTKLFEFSHCELSIYIYITTFQQQLPLVEEGLLTLPEHLSSPLVFSGFVLLDL